MKKRRTKNSIPRPKNSFMTYRQEKQNEIIARNGRINNTVISEIAGLMWRTEEEHVKKAYREKAELGKLEHKRLYPNYKYSPKKPKTPKSRNAKITAKLDLHKNLKRECFDKIVDLFDQDKNNAFLANIYTLPNGFLDTTDQTTSNLNQFESNTQPLDATT
ncbi:hypothetical protein L0F63_005828 [Massospora cicadina]|nr:hypothetical protein L0F63_005828 [Massospora cicadina]